MKRIIIVEKSRVFGHCELEKIASELAGMNRNLIVFGLPNSGKSTLIKAVLKKNGKFCTINEEELLEEWQASAIVRTHEKKWIVSHKYPTTDENVPDEQLQRFLAERLGLNPEKWAIIRIKAK
jgi:adenylate kinase family enzyme